MAGGTEPQYNAEYILATRTAITLQCTQEEPAGDEEAGGGGGEREEGEPPVVGVEGKCEKARGDVDDDEHRDQEGEDCPQRRS